MKVRGEGQESTRRTGESTRRRIGKNEEKDR